MTARLYADENYPLEVVDLLREFGHDVVTIQERGQANLSVADPNVLSFAIAEQRALLTEDRGFRRLHRVFHEHWGIVHNTYDEDDRALATRIHDKLQESEELKGRLVLIYKPNDPLSGHGRGKRKKK